MRNGFAHKLILCIGLLAGVGIGCESKKSRPADGGRNEPDAMSRRDGGGRRDGDAPDVSQAPFDAGGDPSCPRGPAPTDNAPREVACPRSAPYEIALRVRLGDNVRFDSRDGALDAAGRLHVVATREYPFPWTATKVPIHSAVDQSVSGLSRTTPTELTLRGPFEKTWPGILWLTAYLDEDDASEDSIAAIAQQGDLMTFEPVAIYPCSSATAELVFDHRLINLEVSFVNDLPTAWSGEVYVSQEVGIMEAMAHAYFIGPVGTLSSSGPLTINVEARVDFQDMGLHSLRLVAPMSAAIGLWVDTVRNDVAPRMPDVGEPAIRGRLLQCWTGNSAERADAVLVPFEMEKFK